MARAPPRRRCAKSGFRALGVAVDVTDEASVTDMAARARRGVRPHRHPREQRRAHGGDRSTRPHGDVDDDLESRARRQRHGTIAVHARGRADDEGARLRQDRQPVVGRRVQAVRCVRALEARARVDDRDVRVPTGAARHSRQRHRARIHEHGGRLARASPEGRAFIEQTVPIPFGEPEDLCGALLFLVSPAGDWVTGQTLNVDGGWIIRL